MKRIWSIEEQTVREPATGFFLEFTSAPTETSDGTVTLNIWNEGRTRKLVIQFARNGLTTDSTVDHASGAAEVPTTAGTAVTPEVFAKGEVEPGRLAGWISTKDPYPEPPDHGLVRPVHF